jgi:ComF family protein
MVREFIHLFFPRLCPACSKALLRNETLICFTCKHHLPKTNFHLMADNPVSRLFWGRVPLSGASAYFYFRKEGKVQRLLHELKYRGGAEIGREIGRMYGTELLQNPVYSEAELIIPVPLHPAKLEVRGYNQSDAFGEGLAEKLSGQFAKDSLIRVINTETQTRKGRFERWENVETVFAVENREMLTGKKVMLVDDVITTGATLESCASHLLNAGAASVGIVCIAASLR